MNSVSCLINIFKNIFVVFGCWLLSEKFSGCLKSNGFARLSRVAAPLAHVPMFINHVKEGYVEIVDKANCEMLRVWAHFQDF